MKLLDSNGFNDTHGNGMFPDHSTSNERKAFLLPLPATGCYRSNRERNQRVGLRVPACASSAQGQLLGFGQNAKSLFR